MEERQTARLLPEMTKELEVIIGLEVHAQMNTNTKMFCGCDNDAWNKPPNTTVCPICMGHPGTLPVINEEAVKLVHRVGLALGGEIQKFSRFDRKNYFYPDLPKGGYKIRKASTRIRGGAAIGVSISRGFGSKYGKRRDALRSKYFCFKNK